MEIFSNPWVLAGVAVVSLALSTFLPIKVKNPELRKKINWLILIPTCFIIMFYVYPAGIEFFKKLALSF